MTLKYPLTSKLFYLPDHLSVGEKCYSDELGYQDPYEKSSKIERYTGYLNLK